MRRKATTIFLFWYCFSAAACLSQEVAKQPDDTHIFLEALALSYNGNHDEAKKKFWEYRKNHPNDHFTPLRLFYDRFFDVHSSRMEPSDYQEFLGEVNQAIFDYETQGCDGPELEKIGDDTLDCEYVGAALYSFREVLRVKNEGPFKTGLSDDKKFLAHAAYSKSLQTQFLLGVHEYQLSLREPIIRWALRREGLSTDQKDAIRRIIASLADTSPLADDIWFYILRMEMQHKEGAELFIRKYPPAKIIARLKAKYPDNRIFRENTDSFEIEK